MLKKKNTPVASLPESLLDAHYHQDCPPLQAALVLFTDLCLVCLGLRTATSQEELLARLDDSLFPKMYTAYFYPSEVQELSIRMKTVRARWDRGLKT